MNIRIIPRKRLTGERGAVAVYTAVILSVLIMFTAMAVDVGHLYGVRNELNNAADAGALAGAHELIGATCDDLDEEAAIAEADRVTKLNSTGNQKVTDFTIKTIHWSFDQGESEGPINAVWVTTRRTDTPSFFARIFGYDDFFVTAEAVAWIGPVGALQPTELDQPIAICKESITDPKTGEYTCNMGRMLNSGGDVNTADTAMWTNFTQPCSAANDTEMNGLTKVCGKSNLTKVSFGAGMGTVNGVQDNIFGNVTDCWLTKEDKQPPDKFWPLVLPVIDCQCLDAAAPGCEDERPTCKPLVGAVKVNVVWIIYKNDPISQMKAVPTKMEDWSCDTTATRDERFSCWKSFVEHFKLQNVTGPPTTDDDYEKMYQHHNIFFLPDCTDHEPIGTSGGEDFGICSRIPKLVK